MSVGQHNLSATTVDPDEVPQSRAARWAIGLAGLVAVVFLGLTVATFTGSAVADDGAGMHFALAVALVTAFALAMVAFTQAVAAKVQHQQSALLWLPLLALPALIVYVVFSSRF